MSSKLSNSQEGNERTIMPSKSPKLKRMLLVLERSRKAGSLKMLVVFILKVCLTIKVVKYTYVFYEESIK
jgi:hypothetical protein